MDLFTTKNENVDPIPTCETYSIFLLDPRPLAILFAIVKPIPIPSVFKPDYNSAFLNDKSSIPLNIAYPSSGGIPQPVSEIDILIKLSSI